MSDISTTEAFAGTAGQVHAVFAGEAKPTVVVYAEPLLAPSMTFVRAQAEALQRFTALYVGARAVSGRGLALPPDRTLVINTTGSRLGRIREMPFKVFGRAPLFFRKVKRFAPAMVHAHFGPAALTVLPLASWLGVPLITTFHGYDATVLPQFAGAYTHRRYVRSRELLIAGGALFIAVSRYIRDLLLAQGFPEERVRVHYIGVNTELFRPQSSRPREPVVLFVARLTEKKGCEYAIRAMQQVQSSRPDCEFVIIGEGPLRPRLERLATEHLRRYRFLGVQPSEVIREWMGRARVFCVPSIVAESGDAEGFGIVFAEAQAMELPVVSFASGGVPEAVADGQTGFLAPERDWRQLATHILRLLTDDDLWQRLSRAGRERMCSCFNLSSQTRKLEQFYDLVLERQA